MGAENDFGFLVGRKFRVLVAGWRIDRELLQVVPDREGPMFRFQILTGLTVDVFPRQCQLITEVVA